jgi:hypothetical protein
MTATRFHRQAWINRAAITALLAAIGAAPAKRAPKAPPPTPAPVVLPPMASEGPIPIHFKLDRPGVVTLVIEDASGRRVRNLVADRSFPAGDNVV